jgi:nicotinate phosphoribosyltransferase
MNVQGTNAAMLTDLYQLTMAYGYWKTGLHEREAVFHVTFRSNPFEGGYSVAAGLELAIDFLSNLRFSSDDLDYLASVPGRDGAPVFDRGFLRELQRFELALDVDAVPEGTLVFPNEPLVRVRGPFLQAQLVETTLLNLINFQTLIATKAARVVHAAEGDEVIEFGLRRAQGPDGGVGASRAAWIGGCHATSNVLAGKLFGIPLRGTHAHSWVMAFGSEIESFEAYAEAMPNNTVLLVDTFDTLEGVRNAVKIARSLRERGQELLGVRLDSGDLAYLSIEARKILDEAGFPDVRIVATNDLDEEIITSLKQQGAKINVWGVGTRLATAWEQPALGGVYKLAALRDESGQWRHTIKLSEQTAKVSIPGSLQVRRFRQNGLIRGDMIWDELDPPDDTIIIDPLDPTRRKVFGEGLTSEELLIPIFRGGRKVYDVPPLAESRERTIRQLETLHPTSQRLVHPHIYPVGLARNLHERRTGLILRARGVTA